MDDQRFDSLVRSLASGGSRRQVLKGMLGIGVVLGGAAATQGADAARRGFAGPTFPTLTPCQPVCVGSTCGRNGCGGTCSCGDGRSCIGGNCCYLDGQGQCCPTGVFEDVDRCCPLPMLDSFAKCCDPSTDGAWTGCCCEMSPAGEVIGECVC